MTNKKTLVASSLLLAITTFTAASAMAESMADQIKKRAGNIGEVKALLNNSDPSIRMAALDTMLKSDDTAMRETAYSMGLNSADDTLRAIALRNKFNDLKVLHVQFQLPEGADDKVKAQFAAFGGSLVLNIQKYEEKNGRFSFMTVNYQHAKDGNISGLVLQFESGFCKGNLAFNEESIYSGNITCKKITFPATLEII
ncbi:hypothetical protein ACFL6Z_11540 [Pseudomonadota bacterium]